MFGTIKIGGIWQIWNVTCDGSIIVENIHRNMGFFKKPACKKVKALIHTLKAIKPAFSLSKDFSEVVLDSNLEKDSNGFHVFDYVQLRDAGMDINSYIQVIDFRLGSFVVFTGNLFTAERIADELDAYPGRLFLIRHLRNRTPAPIELADILEVLIPSSEDVKTKLLEFVRESWDGDYKQCEPHKLEEQVESYIDTYCYPDLDLKLPSPCYSK